MNTSALRKSAGFSLIEVLVAVVVLSVGLLALANLQTTLMRASADSKSQSVALSLAKDALEQRRAYDASTDYLTIVGVDKASATTFAGGDTTYSIWSEVERYAWNKTNGAFEKQTNLTATLGADFERGNEFKVIKTYVEWTDATNTTNQIELQDAVGALAPENTARVTRKRLDTSNRKPKVIISDPSLDAGVLPIAIGDGSETAATNPRPTIVGNAGDAIKETNYDIFTYAALKGTGTAQAQARVETSIVGCRCDTADAVTGSVAYRPTFWNGTRYTVPKAAKYTAPSNEDLGSGGKPAVTQSSLCSTCCRDHHDDITGTDGPEFSPDRAAHTHFLNGVGTAVTAGQYDEACRLIRVDGFFRVAADPSNEHLNLLETSSDFTLPPPDAVAGKAYEKFVIDYLNTQFTNRSSGYNTSLTDDEANGLAADLKVDNIGVEQNDIRWLHSRGLYVDHLETDAISAINNAKSNCASPLTTSECVLRVLPFTSINLTEVSAWLPSTGSRVVGTDTINDFGVIAVSNFGFVESLTSGDPVRGKVQAKGQGETLATAQTRTSNSGLIGDPNFFINPDEATPEEASQQFTVKGPACGNATEVSGDLGNGTSIDSSAECEAIPGASAIFVTVNIKGIGSRPITVSLISPSGVTTVLAASVATDGTYTYSPKGVAYEKGKWTVVLAGTANPASTVGFTWSLIPAAAVYDVLLDGYTFAATGTTRPSLGAKPSATCNLTEATSTYGCSSTSANVATSLTLGGYNYSQGTKSYGSLSCLGSNNVVASCANVTAAVCLDFEVTSASNGADSGTVGTATGTGSAETTTIDFTSVANGDDIVLKMSRQADLAPSCVSSRASTHSQFCNSLTISCP